MNNNRYKSKWIFHRLDQRDLVDLLLKDHEVKVWLKWRVLIKELINNARLIILHHSLCCIIHTRPKKRQARRTFSLDDFHSEVRRSHHKILMCFLKAFGHFNKLIVLDSRQEFTQHCSDVYREKLNFDQF